MHNKLMGKDMYMCMASARVGLDGGFVSVASTIASTHSPFFLSKDMASGKRGNGNYRLGERIRPKLFRYFVAFCNLYDCSLGNELILRENKAVARDNPTS